MDAAHAVLDRGLFEDGGSIRMKSRTSIAASTGLLFYISTTRCRSTAEYIYIAIPWK